MTHGYHDVPLRHGNLPVFKGIIAKTNFRASCPTVLALLSWQSPFSVQVLPFQNEPCHASCR